MFEIDRDGKERNKIQIKYARTFACLLEID